MASIEGIKYKVLQTGAPEKGSRFKPEHWPVNVRVYSQVPPPGVDIGSAEGFVPPLPTKPVLSKSAISSADVYFKFEHIRLFKDRLGFFWYSLPVLAYADDLILKICQQEGFTQAELELATRLEQQKAVLARIEGKA